MQVTTRKEQRGSSQAVRTIINNQSHIVAQQRSPSSSPFAPHSKTGPGTDRPEKVQGKWGRQTRGMVCGFISQNSSPLLALSVPIRENLPSQREGNLLCLGIRSRTEGPLHADNEED